MFNISIFVSSYILVICSVLGYGLFFEKLFYKKNVAQNIGYSGLIGIFFLIIYSYTSHFFIAHNYIHNSVLVFIGLILFLKFMKIIFVKLNFSLIIIFILLFVGLLLFKTHDDFPYYHFPYSYYLVEHKMIIGVGQFNHGFKTPSSIFYLNSLFFLPFVKYYSFYFSSVLLMGFSNLIIISKILEKIKNKNIDYTLYFYLLVIVFINIFFYRIQEHGTDRSAQILIFILFAELIIFIKFSENNKININNIFILMGLIISLKSFYILYTVILFPILFILYKEKKLFLIKDNLNNKFFILFILLLILMMSINFFNSGCLIYPVSQTCFDLPWSLGAGQAEHMNQWYQQWSKAGATPNFRVDNPEIYIKHFNWVSNWFSEYFFNKVSDFILGTLTVAIIFIFVFYKKNKIDLKISRYDLIIYLTICGLLFEWFYKHPALRYGGYCLISMIIFYPTSLILQKFNNNIVEIKNKILVLMLITTTIFLTRNIVRISYEIEKYGYDPLKNINYRLDENHFRIDIGIKKLINNYENCENNNSNCEQIKNPIVKKALTNNYIIIINND